MESKLPGPISKPEVDQFSFPSPCAIKPVISPTIITLSFQLIVPVFFKIRKTFSTKPTVTLMVLLSGLSTLPPLLLTALGQVLILSYVDYCNHSFLFLLLPVLYHLDLSYVLLLNTLTGNTYFVAYTLSKQLFKI